MIFIDNHVHVGWYSDGYHSPEEIIQIALKSGLSEIAVSSTTIEATKCLHKQIVREFKELIKSKKIIIHPILWVRPDMFKGKLNYVLPYFLRSVVKWEGIKLHFEAHPEWSRRKDLVNKAILLSRKIKVPIMLHSGGEHSNASVFEEYIKDNSDVHFVLAHGSPPSEAMFLLNKYANVLIDTASMTNEIIYEFVKSGYSCRMLFGTDTALCSHEEGIDNQIEYVKSKIKYISSISLDCEFMSIMNRCPYVKG